MRGLWKWLRHHLGRRLVLHACAVGLLGCSALLFAICLLICDFVFAGEQPPQRPYRIDDTLAQEEVETDSLVFSPDGQSIAFVRRRSALSQLTNGLLIPETRGDVWLHEAPGKSARNLTNGSSDSSGWWNPQWSHDGSHLAFLSTRGGNVSLWMWDRTSDQVRQLSARGVAFRRATSGAPDVGRGVFYSRTKYLEVFRWLDDRHILFLALPEGELSIPSGTVGRAVVRATEAWAKAARGEVSSSVVNSLEFRYPERELLLIEVTSGKAQHVATTQSSDITELVDPALWWLSPNAHAVAFVPHVNARYQKFEQSKLGLPWPIELRFLDGRTPHLDQSLPTNVITQTLVWSPDGRELAFFAYGEALVSPELLYGEEGAKSVVYPRVASRDNPARLWRVNIDDGRVEEVDVGDIDLGQGVKPPPFKWTLSGDFLFHANRRSARGMTNAKPQWLLLGRGGKIRPLVSATTAVLSDLLWPVEGGAAFIGIAEGHVWRIDAASGSMTNLTEKLTAPVIYIYPAVERNAGRVIVSVHEPKDLNEKVRRAAGLPVALGGEYVLDLRTGECFPVSAPAPKAALVAFNSRSNSSVYVVDDRTGTYLFRSSARRDAATSVDVLVETNTFWQRVAKGARKVIDYTTLNGEKMKALLVLPPDYQPSRRYPLVVDFATGGTPENDLSFYFSDSDKPEEIPDSFAAAGYVYMRASWPATSMDDAGRANLLLGTQGVMPAVEKAIELGIADLDRLFMYGMSQSAYGVFALVTQTSRFKAAVAQSGWVDQVTMTLPAFDFLRYTDSPFEKGYRGAVWSPYNMLPFWLSADHLRRNSPLSYVDRVRTPLMIIHSDFDEAGISITQPEMFFAALILQRKPARFVRYWGEGHGNRTPANVRDAFQRIFAWYDDYGDITRDAAGHIIFDGDRAKSRNGAPPLLPEDFARFGPAAPSSEATR